MERQKKKQNGITLIALVISIIVMLILAGVSLNMTIGENGIISQAQKATIESGRAVLEEFLHEQYVENYDNLENQENKVLALMNLPKTSSFFYKPTVGALKYVVDSEGHALYLINKEGLPNDIKNSLVGGDAGEKKYSDYQTLNDVYGVTTDLKVYYSAGSGATLVGVSKDDLDLDNPNRIVLSASNPLAKYVNGGTNRDVTAEEIKNKNSLNIDGKDVSSLTDLYNFTSLKNLTLTDFNGSLSGLENATQIVEITMNNCNISDYSIIGSFKNQLSKLCLYNTTDGEVEKLCNKNSTGIGNYDFIALTNFGIVGNMERVWSLDKRNNYTTDKSQNTLTTVACLDNLSEKTKETITTLNLQNNNISGNLKGLLGFKKVKSLRLECNLIESLYGIQNMNELEYISAANNKLGLNEIFDTTLENNGKNNDISDENCDSLVAISNISTLKYISFSNNRIIWVDYILNSSEYEYMWLINNTTFNTGSVANIAETFLALNSISRNINENYYQYMNTSEIIKYESKGLKDSSEEISYLEGLVTSGKALSVKCLSLYNNPELTNTKIQNLLKGFTGLISLDIGSCSNISSLDFLQYMKNTIKFVAFDNTAITGDEVEKLNACTNILGVAMNNKDINLSKMQPTLNRCCTTGSKYTTRTFGYFSLYIYNADLAKKLEDCTELTTLYHYGCKFPDELDLSSTKITKIFSNSSIENCDLTLPSTIKTINDYGSPKTYSFASGVAMTHYEIHGVAANILERTGRLQKGLKDANGTCDEFLFLFNNNNTPSLEVFKYLEGTGVKKLHISHYFDGQDYKISDFNETTLSKLTSLEQLYLRYCKGIGGSLNGIEKCTNLRYLEIANSDIEDISAISGCTNLYSLNLQNNSISNVYPLKNLKQLVYLNLQDNCLYDKSVYIDAEGKEQQFNTLDIFRDLHYKNGGALKRLYISGNTGIIDYSKVSNLDWPEGKSGF